MPLNTSATQTTATNKPAYFNSRRLRVSAVAPLPLPGDRSFNDFVSKCRNGVGHGEIHRLGGFQIDDEKVPRRLLDGQVGRFLALKDAGGERGGAIERFALVGAVGHKAAIANDGVVFIDRRQLVRGGVINYALAI